MYRRDVSFYATFVLVVLVHLALIAWILLYGLRQCQSPLAASAGPTATAVKKPQQQPHILNLNLADQVAQTASSKERAKTQTVNSEEDPASRLVLPKVLEPEPAPKPEPEPKVVETPDPKPKPKAVEAPKRKPTPKIVETPKPKPKVAEKPKPKPEPKVAEKPKPKPEPKVPEKPKPKPEPKVVEKPKPKPKPEPKKEAPKIVQEKPAPKPKPETKTEPKVVEAPTPEPRVVTKAKPKDLPPVKPVVKAKIVPDKSVVKPRVVDADGGSGNASTGPQVVTAKPTTSSGSSNTSAPAIADMRGYRKSIEQTVTQRLRVPKGISAANQPEVLVKISRSGKIVYARLSRTSGSSELDRAAIDAVRIGSQLLPLPDGYEKDTYEVPIKFQID